MPRVAPVTRARRPARRRELLMASPLTLRQPPWQEDPAPAAGRAFYQRRDAKLAALARPAEGRTARAGVLSPVIAPMLGTPVDLAARKRSWPGGSRVVPFSGPSRARSQSSVARGQRPTIAIEGPKGQHSVRQRRRW